MIGLVLIVSIAMATTLQLKAWHIRNSVAFELRFLRGDLAATLNA